MGGTDKYQSLEKSKPEVIPGRKASARIDRVERLLKGRLSMFPTFKEVLFWCLGGSAVAVPTSLLTVYYAGGQEFDFGSATESSKLIDPVPFAGLDAAEVCRIEAHEKFDGQLLNTSVNWHSTRFQKSRNVFVVMLDGSVGTYTQQESVNIYCYVSPKTQAVSYFKAYDSSNRPMLSNAINMDAMLKSFSSDD